jgi:hypothetical protein
MAENQRTCGFTGCGRPHEARGLCAGHYLQQRRGKPITALRVEMTLSERIDLHTDKTGDCWLWTASKTRDGYGQVRADEKPRLAHRVAYELAFGAIPAGMQIDHRCRKRACVRPDHLRLATNKENGENQAGARSDSKSGVRGVYWNAASRKWVAQVVHNGRQHHLGYFATVEEAGAVARAKRLELFTHNDADRLEG